jgi:hypothetical protein
VGYILPWLVWLNCLKTVWSMGSCVGWIKPANSSFPYGFKLKTDFQTTWSDSYANMCKTLHPDAQLAYFRERAAFLQGLALLSQSPDNKSWIAVRQFNNSGLITDYWYWADGVPLNGNATYPRYFQWASLEPNAVNINLTTQTRCGSLLTTNKQAVSDDPCNFNQQSLCEVHGMFFDFILVSQLCFFRLVLH